jgi:hypothetical protein
MHHGSGENSELASHAKFVLHGAASATFSMRCSYRRVGSDLSSVVRAAVISSRPGLFAAMMMTRS